VQEAFSFTFASQSKNIRAIALKHLFLQWFHNSTILILLKSTPHTQQIACSNL